MTFRKCAICEEQARRHGVGGDECIWCHDCCNDMKFNGKHDTAFFQSGLRGKHCNFCLSLAVLEVGPTPIVCWNHKYCNDKCDKKCDGSHSIVLAEFEVSENRNTDKTR